MLPRKHPLKGTAIKKVADYIGKRHIGGILGYGITPKTVLGIYGQGAVKLRSRKS